MDGRLSSAPSSSSTAAAAAVSFPEENAIVLDKWLVDVCGEEDLQFPSHRRALYPAYVERLRRVSKSRQFIANTFDYPSRSGTREVLVLQKTLEALSVEEQRVRREINGVQENVTQVRRVLDERTMGAASLVEEEKLQAAKLAAMRAEQAAAKTAAAAPGTTATPSAAAGPSLPSKAGAAAHPRGHAQLGGDVSVAVVTAPPRPTPAKSDTPLPMTVSYDDDDDDHSTANSSVSTRSLTAANNNNSTSSRDSGQSGNTFSAIARAARRADYDKKKLLAQRYLVEVRRQSQSASERRAEVQARHTTLCAQKKQLVQEYEALKTTEALVVARHEEAEAHNHEETALLTDEVAAYAAEDAGFAAVWEDVEAEAEAVAGASVRVGDASPPNAASQTAACHEDPAVGPTDDTSPPPDRQTQQEAHDARADSTVGSASRTPAEHDVSPPEAHLTTDRPPSLGSDSVASSTADAASHKSSPVERVLRLGTDEDAEEREKNEAAPAQPSPAVDTAVAAAHNKQRRRADLEELRRRVSELGAVAQTCKRQLLNTSQTHMGRFRQAQQRLKDWQDVSARLRATCHQRQGQVAVLQTALQDAAARLDADSAGSTYTHQLFKLNEVLKGRSYETLQYYMGSGDAAAEMLLDANAEEELRALHRPSLSAAAGGTTPLRGAAGAGSGSSPYSAASSAAPTREGSASSAYGGNVGAAVASTPHKHRSRYEVVRHLQRWEAALLVDRLAILKAACMTPGPFNGAGANTKKAEGFDATRCYQELRHLLLQAKQSNGMAAA